MVTNYHCKELLSPALEAMCNKKIAKLDKFNKDGTVDVYMSLEGKEHLLKMILKTNRYEIVAKSKSPDMYKNIDLCVDSLKSQLIDRKVDRTGKKAPEYVEEF